MRFFFFNTNTNKKSVLLYEKWEQKQNIRKSDVRMFCVLQKLKVLFVVIWIESEVGRFMIEGLKTDKKKNCVKYM
eukprot:UN08657